MIMIMQSDRELAAHHGHALAANAHSNDPTGCARRIVALREELTRPPHLDSLSNHPPKCPGATFRGCLFAHQSEEGSVGCACCRVLGAARREHAATNVYTIGTTTPMSTILTTEIAISTDESSSCPIHRQIHK